MQEEEGQQSLECIQANQIFPKKSPVLEEENLQVNQLLPSLRLEIKKIPANLTIQSLCSAVYFTTVMCYVRPTFNCPEDVLKNKLLGRHAGQDRKLQQDDLCFADLGCMSTFY